MSRTEVAQEVELKKGLRAARNAPIFRNQNVSGALRELGSFYDSVDRFEEALDCYKENLPICISNMKYAKSQKNLKMKQGFASNLGNAYHDLALTYKYCKDYKQSEANDLLYLSTLQTAYGKTSARVVPAIQSLIHLYQEALMEEKLENMLNRLETIYAKSKPDLNDQFFEQAKTYTSGLPSAKGKSGFLDKDYFRILIASEKVNKAYKKQDYPSAIKRCRQALDQFTSAPARTTFLEFLISIHVTQEAWSTVADTLSELIALHPDLSEGKYNLQPHVEMFRTFDTLSTDQQVRLKVLYRSLAGPNARPTSNIARFKTLLDPPSSKSQPQMLEHILQTLETRKAEKELKKAAPTATAEAPAPPDSDGLYTCGKAGCSNKETQAGEFKVCSRCKKSSYCSVQCQRKAWRKHKVWCSQNVIESSA